MKPTSKRQWKKRPRILRKIVIEKRRGENIDYDSYEHSGHAFKDAMRMVKDGYPILSIKGPAVMIDEVRAMCVQRYRRIVADKEAIIAESGQYIYDSKKAQVLLVKEAFGQAERHVR
jgi:hypothetical protein